LALSKTLPPTVDSHIAKPTHPSQQILVNAASSTGKYCSQDTENTAVPRYSSEIAAAVDYAGCVYLVENLDSLDERA
jgi:hypothetical protein